ncbi:MAG: LytTR family DNA-binding domain-containing protein [Pseudomonadota bacterium]
MSEPSLHCANDSPMSLALRETRGIARAPRAWVGLAVIAALIGLIGPFGTFDALTLPERLAYWAANVAATFFTATFAITLAEAWLSQRIASRPLTLVLAALLAAVPVTIIVLTIAKTTGADPRALDIAVLYLYCAFITLGVALLSILVRTPKPAAMPDLAPPPLLGRLPLAKRGRLIRLSAQDHYTEVVTDAGSELVLMRLADAIAEAAPTEGLRIHRSHWVANWAVTCSHRRAGRVFVTLKDGGEVPVSRSQINAARAAGLV